VPLELYSPCPSPRRRKERLPLSATSLLRVTSDLSLPAVCRPDRSISTLNYELSTFCSCLSFPNSFALILLCNPLQLTPCPSQSYKNTMRPPISNFQLPPPPSPFRPLPLRVPKSRRINTYAISCKCCIQRTYRTAKSFRFRTYKKQGGGACYC
jgi:hypothetical protein